LNTIIFYFEKRISLLTTTIEILGATLEEAFLKKGEFFQVISNLFCEVKRGLLDH
jgi:hypothetical protein